jgi:ribosomal protein L32
MFDIVQCLTMVDWGRLGRQHPRLQWCLFGTNLIRLQDGASVPRAANQCSIQHSSIPEMHWRLNHPSSANKWQVESALKSSSSHHILQRNPADIWASTFFSILLQLYYLTSQLLRTPRSARKMAKCETCHGKGLEGTSCPTCGAGPRAKSKRSTCSVCDV